MILVGLGGYRDVFKVEDVSGKKICLFHSQVPVFLTGIFFKSGQMFTAAGSVIPVGIRIGCNGDPDPGGLS